LIVFDNVDYPIWSPSLCRALTSRLWEDRILGQSKTVRMPQKAIFVADGNNLRLRGDLPRRCFPINLDPMIARPWERGGFRHKDLRKWVSDCRGDLLAAILTLAKAWYLAGRPAPEKPMPRLGSFEEWAETVGGILAFGGIPGFLENLEKFHLEADVDAPEWETFLKVWGEVFGEEAQTCQEVIEALKNDPLFAATLPGDLGSIFQDTKKSFGKSFGRALARIENRPFGNEGLAMQRDGSKNGSLLWKVAPIR
jgi:hypothetical protein